MGLFSTFEAVEILKRDKQIASLAAQIERLRAVLMDFVEPFKNYPDGALKDDAKAFPNQALLLRARAALQAGEGE